MWYVSTFVIAYYSIMAKVKQYFHLCITFAVLFQQPSVSHLTYLLVGSDLDSLKLFIISCTSSSVILHSWTLVENPVCDRIFRLNALHLHIDVHE